MTSFVRVRVYGAKPRGYSAAKSYIKVDRNIADAIKGYRPKLDSHGYAYVVDTKRSLPRAAGFSSGGRYAAPRVYVHRLTAFVANKANIPTGKVVDHKNRKRYDNRAENLRIVTPKQNSANRDLTSVSKQIRAGLKKADLSARSRRTAATLKLQGRTSEVATKANVTSRTPERRSANAKKAIETRRKNGTLNTGAKGWATRRKNAKTKTIKVK